MLSLLPHGTCVNQNNGHSASDGRTTGNLVSRLLIHLKTCCGSERLWLVAELRKM